MQMFTPLYIYLHTHWDREWFLPFSTAQVLLLKAVKQTLSAIDSYELPNFYLDGQAIVLEDLLAIEPELAKRISTAMAAGKLSAGPWYVLPDQSLVGGESLIRNLKLGIEITKKFGPPTMIGYNPDTFCHIQDLPRILNGFNIKTALVLRGVALPDDQNVFWWHSTDGSSVLTYWLNKGLSHSIFHQSDDAQKIADDLSARWQLNTANNTEPPMLFSAGGEGMQPPGDIVSKLEKLNNILTPHCKAELVSMKEFLEILEQWSQGKILPELTGDLRNNSQINERFPAYVLDGVSSTRLYLKRANALAEHRLVRHNEPLFALLHAIDIMHYPASELRHVWKLLLQNHPHDSICGCSIDPVHQEMMIRTQQLNSFLDGLNHIASEKISQADLRRSKLFLTPDFGIGATSQRRNCSPTSPCLPAVIGPQVADPDCGNNRLLVFNTSCYAQRAPVAVTWYVKPETKISSSSSLQIDENILDVNHLFHSGGGFYYKPVRRISGWAWTEQIPSLGYSEQPWSGSSFTLGIDKEESASEAKLTSSGNSWKIDNGLIAAKVDRKGNLIVILSISGTSRQFKLGHHFYDVGDAGDSYNFDPLPNDVPIKAELTSIKPGKPGPLVSSVILTYAIDIPQGLDPTTPFEQFNKHKRAKKSLRHNIRTEISLKKEIPILYFETTWENRSRDHRFEVRFNTGQEIKESFAECHFSMAKHPSITQKSKLPVPVGHEIAPQSYFCQRFFIASDQIFFNRGLPEYRTEGNYASITLLRAVSYLSRGRLRTRGGGAGPWEPTPEANCFGLNRCEYAWAFAAGPTLNSAKLANNRLPDEQIIQAYKFTDLFEGRLISFALGKYERAGQQSLVEIDNAALYSTAVYIDNGKLFIRLLNVTTAPQHAVIKITLPVSSPGKVNLAGEDFQTLPYTIQSSGSMIIKLDLKANELITLRFEIAIPQ